MAGTPIAVEYVAIRPDTTGFKSGVEKDVTPALAGLKKQLAGLAVGAAIFTGLKAGLDELKQQEAVLAQTEARLKATGGAANVTAKQVSDLAESLQTLSGKDKEAIQEGENLLLTFKSVRNEVGAGNDIFNQATKAALDLSVAGFGDLTSTTVQLGKALESPAIGLTALRRVGVTFTTDQITLIKSLDATGNKLEAQKVLLAAVEGQVGGAAEAYGKTLPGKLERAKNALNDLEAVVVGAVAPALEQLATVGTAIVGAFTALPQPVQTAIVLLAAVATAAKPIRFAVEGAGLAIGVLKTTVDKAAVAMYDGAGAMSKFGAVNLAQVGTFAAAAGALYILTQRLQDNKKAASDWVASKVDSTASTGDQIAALRELEQALRDQQGPSLNVGVADLYATQAGQEHADQIDQVRERLKELEGEQTTATAVTSAGTVVTGQAAVALKEQDDALKALNDSLRASLDPIFAVMDATKKQNDAQNTYNQALAAAAQAQKDYDAAVKAHGQNSDEARWADLARLKTTQDVQVALEDVGKSTLDLSVATNTLNEKLATNPELLGQAVTMLDQWTKSGAISQEQAYFLAAQFQQTAAASQINGTVTLNIAQAIAALDEVNRKMAEAGGYFALNPTIPGRTAPSGQQINHRGNALGGPVSAGSTTSVNERGMPEVFTDSYGRQFLTTGAGGNVTPLARTNSQQPAGNVTHWSPQINVYGASDPDRTARAMALRLRELTYLTGAR